MVVFFFFFSSRRRHTRLQGDWSSDVCSSDLRGGGVAENAVLDPLLESLKHARWSAKVAVGDPQRNHVAAGIALPAGAPGAGALERRVEIEPHPPVIAKKSRARGPARDRASAYFDVLSSSSSFCCC